MFTKNFASRIFKQSRVTFQKGQSFSVVNTLKNTQKKSQGSFHLYALSALGFSLSTYYFMNQKSISLDQFYELTIDNDFREGETRAIQVGPKQEDKVLVSLFDGQFYCVSNACSHFGFGLDKGFQFGDKISCPLHLAQFSLKDGEHFYGPTYKGLESFEITESNGKIHLKVPKDKLNKSRSLPMSKEGNDSRRFVILGGGCAGLSAAETLRQSGFEGKITIISNEKNNPYDRTILSKFFGAQMKGIEVRSDDYLQEYGINVVKGVDVNSVDTSKNTIRTSDGQTYQYEQLLIATGAKPRVPQIPNINAKGVFTIRNYEDIEGLRGHAKDATNIVIVGAGFIGLESASSIKALLKDKQLNITVLDNASTPLERVLGTEVGQGVQQIHESEGIKFKLQSGIQKVNVGSNGSVESIQLSNGEQLKADVLIVGTGVSPNTQFLPQNIEIQKDGGVTTDIFQKVKNQSNVYAAGDVATYPWWYTGQNVRIEHYNEAIHQGHVAAKNMLGKKIPNDNVPFFWTRFHNKSLQYVGHAKQYDDIYIDGSVKEGKFVAYYIWQNQVVAAATMGRMNAAMIIQEALKQNLMPKAADLQAGRVNIDDIQAKVQAKGFDCKHGKRCGARNL